DRTVQGSREVSRQIRVAYPQRRESIVRSARRAVADRARSKHSGRGLSHQSFWRKKLVERRRTAFANRARAKRRTECPRKHVHLHRRGDGTRRLSPAL